MKILSEITSLFNAKQKQLLEQYLNKKVSTGLIQWKEVFVDYFKTRLPNLINGLKLGKIVGNEKINTQKLATQLEDIQITLASLTYESYMLTNTMNKHEMFRKDSTKSFFNVYQKYLDMIDNEIKDYKTNNVSVENGVVEMIPSVIKDFKIKTVDVEYYPENTVDRSGNDPTPENISSGINTDYWLSEILTARPTTVGAKVTMGFNGYVKFNILQCAVTSKYKINITNVEIKIDGNWIVIPYDIKYYGKTIQITLLDAEGLSSIYSTEYIRITLLQEKPDFVWTRMINNEREALEDETERDRIITNYIYKDKFELYNERTVHNIYSYIFGLYYLKVLLKTYDGDAESTFYSKKFINPGKNGIYIETEESKDDPFTIEYSLLQHDGTYATTNVPVTSNTLLKLESVFSDVKILTNLTENVISLNHIPIADSLVIYINGVTVRIVNRFETINDYQAISNNKMIYFNKKLQSIDIIQIAYNHYTDYIIVKCVLKTNTVYQSADCPKILKFNVLFE